MRILKPKCNLLWLIVWAVLVVAGCSRRDDTPFGQQGSAEVYLSLELDNAENEQSLSKTSSQPVLDPYTDLAVYVINTHEDTLARWASFNEVPSTLKFTPGAYKIVAEYKPQGTKIPGFDAYWYRGEEKFTIQAGDKLPIAVVARLAAAKVSVEFDESFDFYYKYYSVDVRTAGTDSLRFDKTESRCGFFEPGSVRLRFNLLTNDGQLLKYSPEPLAKANAADWYKLKLKVSSEQGNAQVIIVGTDDELNPEKDITIEIPQYFLPKDKPSITQLQGFTNGVEQNLFEGEVPVWSVAANAPGGLSSFVIRMNDGESGALAQKLGGVTSVDLVALPADDPLRTKLKEAGFVWSEALNSAEDASIFTNVWLDFTNVMVADGDGTTVNYDFTVEMTDPYGQTPETNHPCHVKATIKDPKVVFAPITQGNVWANRAFFTIQADYDLNTGKHPVLQYKKTSASDWNTAVEGTDVMFSMPDGGWMGSDGLYSALYMLKGLQPNTEYEFRVVLNSKVAVPEQPKWTTEQILGIPGLVNDGFESGWETASVTTALGVAVQAPPAGWATRNPLTTSQVNLSPYPAGDGEQVAVSDVSANNGTMLVLNPGNYTRKAVQLRTTGWGRGCYSKSGGDDRGVADGFSGREGVNELGSRVRNASAGLLFLGDYSFSQPTAATEQWWWYYAFWGAVFDSYKKYYDYGYDAFAGEVIKEGTVFTSRPASLSFQYTLTPVSGSRGAYVRAELLAQDGTTIANAEWTSAVAQPNMTTQTLRFNYTNTTKPAATLKLLFSSDADYATVGTSGDANPPASPVVVKQIDGSPHVGNVLLIDNVTLGYDFTDNAPLR